MKYKKRNDKQKAYTFHTKVLPPPRDLVADNKWGVFNTIIFMENH